MEKGSQAIFLPAGKGSPLPGTGNARRPPAGETAGSGAGEETGRHFSLIFFLEFHLQKDYIW
jgi:hypothetical protein